MVQGVAPSSQSISTAEISNDRLDGHMRFFHDLNFLLRIHVTELDPKPNLLTRNFN